MDALPYPFYDDIVLTLRALPDFDANFHASDEFVAWKQAFDRHKAKRTIVTLHLGYDSHGILGLSPFPNMPSIELLYRVNRKYLQVHLVCVYFLAHTNCTRDVEKLVNYLLPSMNRPKLMIRTNVPVVHLSALVTALGKVNFYEIDYSNTGICSNNYDFLAESGIYVAFLKKQLVTDCRTLVWTRPPFLEDTKRAIETFLTSKPFKKVKIAMDQFDFSLFEAIFHSYNGSGSIEGAWNNEVSTLLRSFELGLQEKQAKPEELVWTRPNGVKVTARFRVECTNEKSDVWGRCVSTEVISLEKLTFLPPNF